METSTAFFAVQGGFYRLLVRVPSSPVQNGSPKMAQFKVLRPFPSIWCRVQCRTLGDTGPRTFSSRKSSRAKLPASSGHACAGWAWRWHTESIWMEVGSAQRAGPTLSAGPCLGSCPIPAFWGTNSKLPGTSRPLSPDKSFFTPCHSSYSAPQDPPKTSL